MRLGFCFGALLALLGGQTAAESIEDRLVGLTEALGQGRPLVRIGLEHAHRVAVSAKGGLRILDADTGEPLWRPRHEGEIQVVAEGGPREGIPAVFRIQVGAFGSRQAAEAELNRLSSLVGADGIVRHDPDRGTWRVRIGESGDRVGLGELMDRLRGAGVQGLWIAEESERSADNVRLRLVDASYDSFPTGASRLALVPSAGGRVSVDGKPYRGLIELRVSPFGTVRAINWIEIEQYLKGVVPAELGPEVWPEIEALKAQSVAARTYVWRNREQFADEGFDLCATPRCQVYRGASAEHPLSDRAIWATRGEILTWQGRPIVALYTATCGGHTENGGEIFPEHTEPYLRGVPCRAESDALATRGFVVTGRAIRPVTDPTGADVTRDWALLSVTGVIPDGLTRPEQGQSAVDARALHDAASRLAGLAGLATPPKEAQPVPTLGRAAATLLATTGWEERAEVLIAGEDLAALLRDKETATLPPDERRAMAYLALMEALSPYPDGRYRPQEAPTLARLAPALVRIGESYKAFGLNSATVAAVGENGLSLVRGKSSILHGLAKELAAFGRSGGKRVPMERLELWPGDRVSFRTRPSGVIDFLELLPPIKGTSDDRSSKVYSWEVRRSRRELEAAINRRVFVGQLQDLQVVRRGVSGRVVELRVIGSKGTTVVRGFDVRRLLDLRESLLVLEIQRNRSGTIDAVVFAGKGWGHGAGLCQVGAYGMALRGADYRAILSHYYTGVRLEPLTPEP